MVNHLQVCLAFWGEVWFAIPPVTRIQLFAASDDKFAQFPSCICFLALLFCYLSVVYPMGCRSQLKNCGGVNATPLSIVVAPSGG